jgi:hypothetical protein
MSISDTTNGHSLQFDVPTWGDYLNGGYGELVAQCSCGQHEYVSSQQEGQYWHWLHRTNAGYRGAALLRLLVESPMPEGWVEETIPTVTALATVARRDRRYTCHTCIGAGSVLVGGGGFGGHFYAYGVTKRDVCPDCSGSGRTERWAAWARPHCGRSA